MKSLVYLALLLLLIPILFSCEDNTTTEVSTCATPVINPTGGTFTTAQNVSITCETAGATILYTLDGTEPADSTKATMTYTAPISVASNKTIKAKAVKSGWNKSLVASASFIVYDQMVSLPAGTFTMGRTSGTGYADELPTHSVTVAPFYMSKYEIKQSEWLAVMGSNPSNFTGDTNKPVEMVSFYDVLVYCNKRSIAEGLAPVYTISGSTNPTVWGAIPNADNATWNAATCTWTANGYRLPTEAEWEYAARGGTNTPDYLYSGSNTVGDVSWYLTNSSNTTHTAGTKAANGLGLFDMSGNVQEWVWDWYNATYYASSSANNPTGPTTGTMHTLRGGSWEQTDSASRVVFRSYGTPEKSNDRVSNSRLGFRVVRLP